MISLPLDLSLTIQEDIYYFVTFAYYLMEVFIENQVVSPFSADWTIPGLGTGKSNGMLNITEQVEGLIVSAVDRPNW